MDNLVLSAVKKNRARLIPFMLMLYVLAFLDRANIGFAKEAYQLDTGLSNEAYALGAGIFFVVYALLGVPANLLMRRFGARSWIGARGGNLTSGGLVDWWIGGFVAQLGDASPTNPPIH